MVSGMFSHVWVGLQVVADKLAAADASLAEVEAEQRYEGGALGDGDEEAHHAPGDRVPHREHENGHVGGGPEREGGLVQQALRGQGILRGERPRFAYEPAGRVEPT